VRRPRLYTVLFVVSLVILALPLGGIGFLRLYESALVRQTESELIGQGAFVAAAYRAALLRAAKTPGTVLSGYGNELTWIEPAANSDETRWRPHAAKLDLAVDRVLPPPPEAPPGVRADPFALAAGREITELMREAQSTTLAAIRVVDHRGTVVATTGEELGLSFAARPEVRNALTGEHVSVLRARILDQPRPSLTSISRGTGVRVFVAVPVIEGKRVLGAVVLARTPADLLYTLYRKRWPIIGGAVFVLVIAGMVVLFTAVMIARPLRAVVAQTQRAVRGEKGAITPLARPGTREVAQLSEAVAQLARTLETRSDYIRDFAAHVSHEFKTPLTAIQGAVELLREHGSSMNESERQTFLRNLEADTVRLSRLVGRLLELARADMAQPYMELTSLAPLLEHIAKRYRDQGMKLELDNRIGEVFLPVGEETLESILGNLLDNARQHAGPDANVAVQALWKDDGRLLLRISDDGSGISAANAERIFEPFFTTAREHGGTGLGLTVVKSLLRAHDAEIRLVTAEIGTTFELLLPASKSSRPTFSM
jgi:signal transduction histidine kinase